MVAGIALLGTVTATLASWLVDQVRAEEEREVSDLRTEIEVLNLKLDQLLATKSTAGLADSEPKAVERRGASRISEPLRPRR
jgi:voltage-gated potassium channel